MRTHKTVHLFIRVYLYIYISNRGMTLVSGCLRCAMTVLAVAMSAGGAVRTPRQGGQDAGGVRGFRPRGGPEAAVSTGTRNKLIEIDGLGGFL